jgi:secreted trypsin-like serine protease
MVVFMKVAAAALFLLLSICDAKNESTTSQSSSTNGIHKKRRMTQAIIGGSEASAGEYPWFAKAVSANSNWAGCGGALVSPQVRRMIMDMVLSTHIL